MKEWSEAKLKEIEQEFETMKVQMEEDKKFHDFSIPKEWDEDFHRAMDKVLEKKSKERSWLNRIKNFFGGMKGGGAWI